MGEKKTNSNIFQALCKCWAYFTSFSKFIYSGIWILGPCALFTKLTEKYIEQELWFTAQTNKPATKYFLSKMIQEFKVNLRL